MSSKPTLSLGDVRASKPSRKEMESILRRRAMGLYIQEETRQETALAVKQMMEHEGDDVFTLIKHLGIFSVFSKKEFMPQLKQWKEQNCVALECNLRQLEADGQTCWMVVIQPPKLQEHTFCPLALAFGMMVSGFSYVFKDLELAKLVIRYLA
jgi:hypothetical protein